MLSKLWNCNRLWKIWYGILITLLQSYSIFNGIRQYINFKSQYFNPRYGGVWDFAPLHFYVACIILSISLMGFFLYFTLINVHSESYSEVWCLMDRGNGQNSFVNITKSVWKLVRVTLPYSHIIHFAISVILLLPLPVIQMEQIRNEAVSPDSIWTADIDFFSEHFEWSKANSLPNSAALLNVHYIHKSPAISLEFLNFSLASLLIVLKMSSVFWSSHKGFSLLFSCLVFFNCLTSLMVYEAGSILIKCAGNTERLGLYPTDPRTKNHYHTLIILIIIQFLSTLSSFFAVFVYGCTQIVLTSLFRYKSFNFSDVGASGRKAGFASVVVVGFVQLIFTLIINSILCSTLFKHFQVFKSTISMVTVIIVIVNVTFNFLVWFTFAIKTEWVFKLELCKVTNINGNTIDQGYKVTGASDAIYGCFHNNITLSSSSSHSSGPGTIRTLEGAGSEYSGHGTNFQNYIYMQANTMQIPTISEVYDENQTGTMKSISKDDNAKSRGQDVNSVSGHSDENMNSDSYRSLQLCDGDRKFSKFVKFEGQPVRFYEKRFSGNDFNEMELGCHKVPDILKVNGSNVSRSHSESSLDHVSSSNSSKNPIDSSMDHGLCSEV